MTELEGRRQLLESYRAAWSALEHLAVGPADSADRARRRLAIARAVREARGTS